MSAVTVKHVYKPEDGKTNWNISGENQSFTIYYKVITDRYGQDDDDLDEGTRDIKLFFRNSGDYPYVGDRYFDGVSLTSGSALVCVDMDISFIGMHRGGEVDGVEVDEGRIYSVSFTYSDAPSSLSENMSPSDRKDFEEDPEDYPMEVSWGSYDISEFDMTWRDVHGKLMANTAGHLYDPEELTQQKSYPQITITRLERNFGPSIIWDYKWTINYYQDFIAGYEFGALKCRMDDISADMVYVRGARYWRVTYVITYNKDGWNPTKFLNTGFADNKGTPRNETNKQPMPGQRILLDVNGDQVMPSTITSPSFEPHYNSFSLYEEISWNSLQLNKDTQYVT